MAVVFDHPKSLLDVSTHFCPGCGHGIVHRLVCEVIDEMGIEGDTIGVVPVGCSVMSYNYFGCQRKCFVVEGASSITTAFTCSGFNAGVIPSSSAYSGLVMILPSWLAMIAPADEPIITTLSIFR